MKNLAIRLILIGSCFCTRSNAQKISPNVCDSLLLTKVEFEKCKQDTAWKADLIVKANYIVAFKTELLPKYRAIRKEMLLPKILQTKLGEIKKIYVDVLNKKLAVFELEMDKNQKYVQPNAYLSSLLSFQLFKFYPDVYAILLNKLHLNLKPKTTNEEMEHYNQLINQLAKSIPADLNLKLMNITSEFNKEYNKLTESKFIKLFQGQLQESEKRQYEIVNFLLWME
jgi:hypothetical protein